VYFGFGNALKRPEATEAIAQTKDRKRVKDEMLLELSVHGHIQAFLENLRVPSFHGFEPPHPQAVSDISTLVFWLQLSLPRLALSQTTYFRLLDLWF
jgi:hypothetical protein